MDPLNEFPEQIDNRVRITLAEWQAREPELDDATAYLYMPEAVRSKMDPWRVIDFVDAADSGLFTICLVSGNVRDDVPGGFPIYVNWKDKP